MTEITLDAETLWDILLKLKSHDILDFCRSSNVINVFCKNDNFWKAKVELDYPGYTKPDGQTWAGICLYLNQNKDKSIKVVMRHRDNKDLEKIIVNPYTTLDNLLGYVNKKYNLFGIIITTGNTYSIDICNGKMRLDSIEGSSIEIARNEFLYRVVLPEGDNLYSLIEAIDIM